MTNPKRVALVTGGNRGLGLETCRQLAAQDIKVILTARTEAKGTEAARALRDEGGDVVAHPLDVSRSDSLKQVVGFVRQEIGRIDILVNNAGISGGGESTFRAEMDSLEAVMMTNTFGPFFLCQQLVPMMIDGGYGRVVNVSSGMGQLTEMNAGYPAYRLSKAALNAVTRIFSEEALGKGVLVNSVCPGWVRTGIGGPEATLSVEEGVDTIVWLATLPDDGPTGGFYRRRAKIPW